MSAIDREFFPNGGWSTISSEPERAGLELIADLEPGDLSYEFDTFAVWRDTATGGLYYAADSGCSCPSPFEWARSLGDLTRVDPNRFDAFISDVKGWAIDYSGRSKVTFDECETFIRTVREAIDA